MNNSDRTKNSNEFPNLKIMAIEWKKAKSSSKEKALTQAKTNDAHYH